MMSNAETRRLERLELEKTIAKLRAEGEILAAKLLNITAKCNACTPAYLLPDEILSSIFTIHRDLTLDLDGPPKGLSERQKQQFLQGRIFSPSDAHSNAIRYNEFVPWIETSHVSRRWRRVAVDTPCLWSTLHLQSLPWTEECIRRSKQAKLHIHTPHRLYTRISSFGTEHLEPISNIDPKVLEMLTVEQVFSRVLRLSTYGDIARSRLQVNPSMFPNLEHLSISHSVPRAPTQSIVATGLLRLHLVLGADPPPLLSLTVDGFHSAVLTELSLPTLEELYYVRSFLWTLGLTECLRILGHMPALRVCALGDVKKNETSSIDAIPQVELPHLETLSLRADSIETTLRLLRKISVPSGLSVQLDVGNQEQLTQPLDELECAFEALLKEHIPHLLTRRARGQFFRSWIIVSSPSAFGFFLSSNPDLAKTPDPFHHSVVSSGVTRHGRNPWTMTPPRSEVVFSIWSHFGYTTGRKPAFRSSVVNIIGEFTNQVESIAYQDIQSSFLDAQTWSNTMSNLPNLSYIHTAVGIDAFRHQILFDTLGGFEPTFRKLTTLALKGVNLYDWSRSYEGGLPVLFGTDHGPRSLAFNPGTPVQQQYGTSVLYPSLSGHLTGANIGQQVNGGFEGGNGEPTSGPTRPSGPAPSFEFPLTNSSSRSGHPLPPMLARRCDKGAGLQILILKDCTIRTDVLAELIPVAPLVWLDGCRVKPAPWEV
ncbi:hypothetical protein DL96DRAFT_1674974 [Flagelloscypha sp. PMI_526]|nr:hypothetical protein DL96DRAFT_1674974 [Flagelloscypha sp. PMI_526]